MTLPDPDSITGVELTIPLATALGAVLWFFFKRVYDKLDDIMRCFHEAETRHHEQILELNNKIAECNHSTSVLFTQVGELKGYLQGKYGIKAETND